jgi:hypothetical protein
MMQYHLFLKREQEMAYCTSQSGTTLGDDRQAAGHRPGLKIHHTLTFVFSDILIMVRLFLVSLFLMRSV